MHLKAADLDGTSARQRDELLVLAQFAGRERPRHDGAEPAHREDAIDRQPRRSFRTSRGDGAREPLQRVAQRVEPQAGLR